MVSCVLRVSLRAALVAVLLFADVALRAAATCFQKEAAVVAPVAEPNQHALAA